jgi:hypothetical protein
MGIYIGMMASVSSSVQPLAACCFIGCEMGCAFGGRWFESEVGNGLCLRVALSLRDNLDDAT